MNEPTAPIRIFIADDHPLMRDGLKTILNAEPDFTVVGTAPSALDAAREVADLLPDLVILDVMMGESSGLDILPLIRNLETKTKHPVRVMFFSSYSRQHLVMRALQGGAYGYVTKTSSRSDFVRAIRTIHSGRRYVSPDISEKILDLYLEDLETRQEDNPYNLLTEREQEIFNLLIQGYSNRKAAELLFISERTIEKHRANLMKKTISSQLSRTAPVRDSPRCAG